MLTVVVHTIAPAGVLFDSSLVHSATFGVLAALVAINTVMYSALAVAKMLPKVYPSSWVSGRSRRARSRSIYPDMADDEPGRSSGSRSAVHRAAPPPPPARRHLDG